MRLVFEGVGLMHMFVYKCMDKSVPSNGPISTLDALPELFRILSVVRPTRPSLLVLTAALLLA